MITKKLKPDDGSGSGGGIKTANSRNSSMYNLHMADFVISLTRTGTGNNPNERYVKILKNRYDGITGKADPKTTIKMCSRMIALSVFGDTSLKLFRVELEEAIKKTIMEKIGDAHDPFQRESTGDGS